MHRAGALGSREVLRVCVCMYIYPYIYIHVYVYMYIHSYIFVCNMNIMYICKCIEQGLKAAEKCFECTLNKKGYKVLKGAAVIQVCCSVLQCVAHEGA